VPGSSQACTAFVYKESIWNVCFEMLDDMTNMVEIMNRFMETSNITIVPKETRVHRLIILRLLYSFGDSVDIAWCKEDLKEAGVDLGDFNQKSTQV